MRAYEPPLDSDAGVRHPPVATPQYSPTLEPVLLAAARHKPRRLVRVVVRRGYVLILREGLDLAVGALHETGVEELRSGAGGGISEQPRPLHAL